MAIGYVNLPEGVELRPGESVECTIDFMDWDALENQIYPGREWRIQEGARLVGMGKILSLLG